MQDFNAHGVKFSYYESKQGWNPENTTKTNAQPVIIWGHGWGQSYESFLPIITSLKKRAHHIALDFPGFGKSPPPNDVWGTEDYADAIASWLKEHNFPPVIWVGHSFGCRVGVRLASRHPELILSMALIAGAGLKHKHPIHKKIYFYYRIKLFKTLKKIIPAGKFKDNIMTKFGSADYKNSGAMRKIFIRTVNEDLSDTAKTINCPTTLIYGTNDTQTPPEFGNRYSQLIKGSKLFLLDEQDHYTVLSTGRHQVIKILGDIIKETGNHD